MSEFLRDKTFEALSLLLSYIMINFCFADTQTTKEIALFAREAVRSLEKTKLLSELEINLTKVFLVLTRQNLRH